MQVLTGVFFDLGTSYLDGFDPVVTSTEVTIGQGSYRILLDEVETFSEYNSSIDYFFVKNDGTHNISSGLDDIDEYADGGSIGNNKKFNVVWIIANRDNGIGVENASSPGRLIAVVQNEPVTQHATVLAAELDNGNLNIFPTSNFLKRTSTPIIRTVMNRQGGVNTIQSLSTGGFFVDLRGRVTPSSGNAPPTVISEHSLLTGLEQGCTDHTDVLCANGSRGLTGNWNVGNFNISVNDTLETRRLRIVEAPVECPVSGGVQSFITEFQGLNSTCVVESPGTDSGFNDTGTTVQLVTSTDNVNMTSLYVNNSNGFVGIGTTTPLSLLTVEDKGGVNNPQIEFTSNVTSWRFRANRVLDRFSIIDNQAGTTPFFIRGPADTGLLFLDLTETIFNENGLNRSLRVEGDNEANLFFVDGANDRIGIGTNTPEEKFHLLVNSSTESPIFKFESLGGSDPEAWNFFVNRNTGRFVIQNDGTSNVVFFS